MARVLARAAASLLFVGYACVTGFFLFLTFRGQAIWEPASSAGDHKLVCGNVLFETPVFCLDWAAPATLAMILVMAIAARRSGGWRTGESILAGLLLLSSMAFVIYLLWTGSQFDHNLIRLVWWL